MSRMSDMAAAIEELRSAAAEGDAAGGVDLLNGQFHAGLDMGAVDGQAAGQGTDHTDGDGISAGLTGGPGISAALLRGLAAAAGGQSKGHTERKQEAQKLSSFHNDSS